MSTEGLHDVGIPVLSSQKVAGVSETHFLQSYTYVYGICGTMHIDVHVHTDRHMHMHMHENGHATVTYICVYMYTYTRAYPYTDTYAYTYTCAYTYSCVRIHTLILVLMPIARAYTCSYSLYL